MSVSSFGNNILDAKVKSLSAQSDLLLSTMDASGFGREYTHHINGPNVANPNNYIFKLYEKATAGQATRELITVTTTNTGSPPFNVSFMTLKSDVITLDGDLFIKNTPSVGMATLVFTAPGTNPSVVVAVNNVQANAVILLTQASGATPLDNLRYVAGVNTFTIYSGTTISDNTNIAYYIASYGTPP